MLDKRREYYLGSGQVLMFRLWSALTFVCMQGLSSQDMPALPTTTAEFLSANRFDTPRDEENTGSGFSPLIISALSGNITVVRELIAGHNVNVNARVRINSMGGEFGMESGMDALAIAACACPQDQAHGMIRVLLEAGANPNSRFSSGGTPLIAAVVRP